MSALGGVSGLESIKGEKSPLIEIGFHDNYIHT